MDMYSSNGGDSVGYVQAASPQPSGYPAIAVSRAPLNYSPVSTSQEWIEILLDRLLFPIYPLLPFSSLSLACK